MFYLYTFFRCEIPQCDTIDSTYNPDWLRYTIPFRKDSNEPQKCLKYRFVQKINETDDFTNDTCVPSDFDINSQEKCNKWVFGETERTIVNDVSCIALSIF